MNEPTRFQRVWSKDYGYCNARVRGMRSRLLGEAYYNDLMNAGSLASVVGILKQTDYGPDLEAVRNGQCTASRVDDALKQHMARTQRTVLGMLNAQAAYLAGTLLSRRDVVNVKTVLRGKHILLADDDIARSLLPAGMVSASELDELVAAPDTAGVLDALAEWKLPYADVLEEARQRYEESGQLPVLELTIDRRYAEWASGRLARTGPNGQLARRLLGAQIDVTNLMTVLHVQRSGFAELDPLTLLLEGGNEIDKDLFADLCRPGDLDEVLDRLKRTPYRRALDEAAVRFLGDARISVFERALEAHLVRQAASYRRDPLGIGVVLAYLSEKENEVTNARIIAYCASLNMPQEQVRKEVIHA